MFQSNRAFRRDYEKLFRRNPLAANLLLLFAEQADDRGMVNFKNYSELVKRMAERFENPGGRQL